MCRILNLVLCLRGKNRPRRKVFPDYAVGNTARRDRLEGTVNGLVKHSLCRAEERRIKDDSTGLVCLAVSPVGTADQQGGSVGRRKVHKAEIEKKPAGGLCT